MTRRAATPYERFQWERSAAFPDDPNLTLTYVYELRGAFDIDRLESALQQVLETDFPGLRNYFVEVGSELRAMLRPVPTRMLLTCNSKKEIFDLGPLNPRSQQLYRFAIWIGGENSALLRVDLSHLVCDGPSVRDFNVALSAAWRGEAVRYGDDSSFEYPCARKDAKDFWTNRLRNRALHQPWGFEHEMPLHASQPVSALRRLGVREHGKMRSLLKLTGATETQLMITLTAALVGMRSGSDDPLVIAHTADVRPSPDRLGCWTNLLPIWVESDPASRSVSELLEEVRQQRREIRPFQEFPTLELLKMANSSREVGSLKSGPALNIVVNPSSATLPAEPLRLDGLDVALVKRPVTATSSELSLTFGSDKSGMHLAFDSHSRLVTPESMDAFASEFITLMGFAVRQPDRPLSECELGRSLAPVAVGAPLGLETPCDLGTAIAGVAQRHLDKVAVVSPEQSMNYRELLSAACGLAAVISEKYQTVGVMVGRSPLIVVSYLAALLAGKPFVPLDPTQPDDRLLRCVSVAGVDVVIVDGTTKGRVGETYGTASVIDVNQIPPSDVLPHTKVDESRVAYVMFTSGSSGEPKGVAVTEGNLRNLLDSVADDPGMVPSDRFLALTPVSFDISLLELLLPLTVGASIEIVPDAVRRDGRALAASLNNPRITVAQATPSTWRALRDVGWEAASPITILCGGEHLEEELAQYLLSQNGALYAMYGPTETTIWAG